MNSSCNPTNCSLDSAGCGDDADDISLSAWESEERDDEEEDEWLVSDE